MSIIFHNYFILTYVNNFFPFLDRDPFPKEGCLVPKIFFLGRLFSFIQLIPSKFLDYSFKFFLQI